MASQKFPNLRVLYLCCSFLLSSSFVHGQKLQTTDSLKTPKQKIISWLNPDSSFLKSKYFKINSYASYESRYLGLGYDGYGQQKFTQNIYLHNQITIYGLPFDFDFNKGTGYLETQRKMANFTLKFNPNQMLQQYGNELVEKEKDKLKKQLEADTNYQKYMEALEQLNYYSSLLNTNSYLQKVDGAKNIINNSKNIDDPSLKYRQSYIDAQNQVKQFDAANKLKDSLQKTIDQTEKLNPLYKTYKERPNINLPSEPTQDEMYGYLRNSNYLPREMKWVTYIRKLDMGIVYPDQNPLLFNGAAIKGVNTRIESKNYYMNLSYGRQMNTGDFFHDTFAISSNRLFYIASGYKSKYITIGGNLLSYTEHSAADTNLSKINFDAPKKSLIPGIELETNYKNTRAYATASYVLEDIQSKTDRFENEVFNKSNDSISIYHNKTVDLRKLGMRGGIETIVFKTKLSLTYRYNGSDFYSPAAPFAAPFSDVIELKADKSFLNNKLNLQVGGNYRKNLLKENVNNLNDRNLSGFFVITTRFKNLPMFTIRYQPMYRQSIWKGNTSILQVNQLTATSTYTKQIRKQLLVLMANYTRQSIIWDGKQQANEVLFVYGMFKPRKTPIQLTATGNYFHKPFSVGIDSSHTIGGKFQVSYTKQSKITPSLYFDYSNSPQLTRKMIGMELYSENKYLGRLQLKFEYGVFEKNNGLKTNGLNFYITFFRKIV